MAETGLVGGAYPDALDLASEIAGSHAAEIAEMEAVLGPGD